MQQPSSRRQNAAQAYCVASCLAFLLVAWMGMWYALRGSVGHRPDIRENLDELFDFVLSAGQERELANPVTEEPEGEVVVADRVGVDVVVPPGEPILVHRQREMRQLLPQPGKALPNVAVEPVDERVA